MTELHKIYVMNDNSDHDYIANLLGAFATAVSTRIEQEIAELDGRSLTHESALVIILNHPNGSIDTSSKTLNLSHSGAVRRINTLEHDKLVQRYKSIKDARSVVLKVIAKEKKRAHRVANQKTGYR